MVEIMHQVPIEGATPETTEALPEITKTDVESTAPYTFRPLNSKDLFLVFKIVRAIGVKEFKTCFAAADVLEAIQNMTENEKVSESGAMAAGISVAFEAADIILGNIGKCEREIYQLLSQTSGIPVEEITADGNAVMFFEMVLDFIRKPEFPDFIKAVSKRFF